MRKLFSFILLSVMLTGLFACAAHEPEVPLSDTPSDTPDEVIAPAEDDFGGKEFIVWQESSETTTDRTPLFFTESTVFAEQMAARIADIEEKTNCEISFNYKTNMYNDFSALTAVGSGNIDLLVTASEAELYAAIENSSLTPMNEVSDIIDLSDSFKYGSKGELEAGTFNSVSYTVSPVALPGKQNFGLVSIGVFLEDYITGNNLISPREYLEKNSWNWDAFRQCLTDYTSTEGENGIKAFNMCGFSFAQAALINNGVENVTTDGEGSYVSGLNSPQTLEAVTFQKEVITDYADCILNNTYAWGEEYIPLRDKQAAMALLSAWKIKSDLAFNVSNFGLFPFPTGPSGVYGEWKTVIDVTEALSIPVLAESPEFSAKLISMMLDPFENYETEAQLAAYYDNLFFDKRDSELFLSIGKSSSFSYWNVGGYNFVYSVQSEIDKRAPQEVVSRYSGKIKDAIEKYMIPNLSFINGTSD